MSNLTSTFGNTPLMATVAMCLALGACGSGPPRANEGSWTLRSDANGSRHVFEAKFRLSGGQDGWFAPNLLLSDKNGCQTLEYLEPFFPIKMRQPEDFIGRFNEEINAKGPISRATLRLIYRPDGAPPGDNSLEKTVFEEERVFDPSVRPASPETCAAARGKGETAEKRRDRLRKKAITDPEGADAEAIDNMGRNELMATAINSAGFLCARVTDMRPSGSEIIVSCVEYRSGSGRVKYKVNAEEGSVEQF